MSDDIEALKTRLAAAEQVCVLFGWSPSTSGRNASDAENAATQAWMDWTRTYPDGMPESQSPEWAQRIEDLAARRYSTREATLQRLGMARGLNAETTS
jgi:hypothetical protein